MLKRWWWVFLVMVPVGPVLGLLTAAVVTYVTPRKYESRAVIEVKPQMVYLDGVAPGLLISMDSERCTELVRMSQ